MNSRDPFRIEGPACISFSGGRTSGYMLWRILQAHGGTLPKDVVVCFANTGKEMPETLDFVQECSERWGVAITWVEYRPKVDGKKQWATVTHATASRNGEPYAALIADRNYLPNPVTRFCTVELKIRPMHKFLRSLGWDEWVSCIGIRADEERRLAKMRARGRSTETPDETPCAPLGDAGITVADVGAFWASNDFDLRLPNMNGKTMHGNCDLCFLKGGDQVLALIRERPERALWWMQQEGSIQSAGKFKGDGARFRSDRPSYAEMHRMATQHGELFSFDDEALQDCACTD
ncbi:MAG: phosphoadenosine phosphosulfate reductase family protein [Leptolyngbyaceae bacterium]|nr:phosphoadenosine phosphosulfate reductase family protein [Leptolyngbyaceae bacterium]